MNCTGSTRIIGSCVSSSRNIQLTLSTIHPETTKKWIWTYFFTDARRFWTAKQKQKKDMNEQREIFFEHKMHPGVVSWFRFCTMSWHQTSRRAHIHEAYTGSKFGSVHWDKTAWCSDEHTKRTKNAQTTMLLWDKRGHDQRESCNQNKEDRIKYNTDKYVWRLVLHTANPDWNECPHPKRTITCRPTQEVLRFDQDFPKAQTGAMFVAFLQRPLVHFYIVLS